MITVGIFGPAADAEVRALAQRLEHRGARAWIVDLAAFPDRLRITATHDGIRVDGRPLLEMDAAYLRRVGTALPPHLRYDATPTAVDPAGWQQLYPEALEALAAERTAHAVRVAVVRTLARQRTVINPPDAQNLHRLKVRLFDLLLRQGAPVPQLAAGSAAGALRDFARRAAARWAGAVDKPMAGIYKTLPWSEEGWQAHDWSRRPALYQRLIPGDTVRAFVLEGRLLSAARIVHGGTVDSSISQTGIETVALDPGARALAEKVARVVGLAFCGMDLMQDSTTGATLIIDCNLSPMFVNYGKLSRCDVAGHLAELLIRRAARREPYQRPQVLDRVDQAKELLANDPDIARLLDQRRRGDE